MPDFDQPGPYDFGPFELRVRTHELFKHGIRVKLRPQPFQLLLALVKRAGDVVTREELRQQLWPQGTFVDFEQGLNTAVKELRGALGDSADEPRYIETLPRVGYRILVPVNSKSSVTEAAPAERAALSVEAALAVSLPTHDTQRVAPRISRGLAVSLAVIFLVILGSYFLWSRSRPAAQPVSTRVILAVLPFENLTGDPGQEYFSDGLTDEMISKLSGLDPQHFGVIARSSVMGYKHGQARLDEIGRELGAQYVLEGSVRRDASTVRVAAQLIQLKDQTHLWSRQYDRELSNLLVLQGEIAREITDEIQATIGERKAAPATREAAMSAQQLAAYDFYLKGLFYWNKRTLEGFQQAIASFEQAIARDPGYAPAHAGLANSYSLLSAYSVAPGAQYMPLARAAALRALELDANLPEAHTALALVIQNYDYDWQTAEKEYRRAIELNPNYATAHQWYAEHLGFRGRFEEAFRESERARQLDPLSLIIAADHAALLYYSRQYDRAIEQFRAVLELDPSFPRAHMIISAYLEKGMFAEALEDLEARRRIGGESPYYWGTLAYVSGRAGQSERSRQALKKLEAAARRERVPPSILAFAYLGSGDRERALTYLETAYAEHWNGLTGIGVEAMYDPLRDEPRFQEILQRIGR